MRINSIRINAISRWVTNGVATTVLVSLTTGSLAQSLVAVPSPPEATLVRDMLQRDAQRALATEQDLDFARARDSGTRTPEAQIAKAVVPPASKQLTLAGIYGLDGALTAEIDINGNRHIFRVGQTQTTGDSAETYRLVAITGPCASLRKPDGQLERLCHPKFQGM